MKTKCTCYLVHFFWDTYNLIRKFKEREDKMHLLFSRFILFFCVIIIGKLKEREDLAIGIELINNNAFLYANNL